MLSDPHPPPMYLCPPSPTAADHESIYWKVVIPSLHQCISGPPNHENIYQKVIIPNLHQCISGPPDHESIYLKVIIRP